MKQKALDVGLSRDELCHTAIQGTLKGWYPQRRMNMMHPRAPNISFSTICMSSHFLCDIWGGPDELVQNLVRLSESRKPQINDLDHRKTALILVNDQNIFRLKISVYNTHRLTRPDGTHDLERDVCCFRLRVQRRRRPPCRVGSSELPVRWKSSNSSPPLPSSITRYT